MRVSQSLGACGSLMSQLRAPCLPGRLVPSQSLSDLSVCLSARPPVGPGDPRCSPVCLPHSRSLPRWLSRSLLALPLYSGSAEAEGGGVGGAREGGGEAPAFLRLGRNLSQRYWSPEEPSCSPGAPPGLLLPARACRDGHGLGLELGAGQGSTPTPAPGRLQRPGTGRSAGAGREGFPNPG